MEHRKQILQEQFTYASHSLRDTHEVVEFYQDTRIRDHGYSISQMSPL